MSAPEPSDVDAVWQSIAAYPPKREEATQPLGCHRPRISDRDCFEANAFSLVTGGSWDVARRLGKGSETTLRRRRDEWVATGASIHPTGEALRASDRVIGPDLSEVSIDGARHKAPAGGEGTGPNPTDRGKTGWKWSVATDTNEAIGAHGSPSVLIVTQFAPSGHTRPLSGLPAPNVESRVTMAREHLHRRPGHRSRGRQ